MAKHISFRTSPVAFVKRMLVAEVFVTFLIFSLRSLQPFIPIIPENLPLIPTISSTMIIIGLASFMQVLLIIIVFISWYTERYKITSKAIIFTRTEIFTRNHPIDFKTIASINTKQHRLGESFNFGSIIIHKDLQNTIELHNIPNPHQISQQIKTLAKNQQNNNRRINSQPVTKLLSGGEGQHLEFKASLQYDYHQKKRNKALHKAIMKNIAAMLNSQGGIILVGVNDKGKVVGLEPDFQTLSKKNSDGWENVFNGSFKKHLSLKHRFLVSLEFETHKDKQVAKIIIQPAKDPVYLRVEDKEEFYIRTGNASQPLSVSEAVDYVQKRFK